MLLPTQEQRCYVPSRSAISRVVWRRLKPGYHELGVVAPTCLHLMNRSIRGRLERLEHEQRFQDWCESVRVIKNLPQKRSWRFFTRRVINPAHTRTRHTGKADWTISTEEP